MDPWDLEDLWAQEVQWVQADLWDLEVLWAQVVQWALVDPWALEWDLEAPEDLVEE